MSLPIRPSLAKSRSAASRRAPATTSNFWPLPAFLTVRFWISADSDATGRVIQ